MLLTALRRLTILGARLAQCRENACIVMQRISESIVGYNYIVNTLFLRQVSLWSFRLSPLAGTNMHLVLVEEDVCC